MKKAVRCLFLFAWSSECVLLGQQPWQVQGRVEDPNGVAVTQAAVRLTPQTGSTALKTVTDDMGRFVFAGVGAGEYLLTVKVQGFEKAELRLQVDTSSPPAQRIRLNLAEVKDEITVSARSD